MADLEYCCECEQPTGRAGEGEDSLFDDAGDGPYCEACWDEREEKAARIREETDGLGWQGLMR